MERETKRGEPGQSRLGVRVLPPHSRSRRCHGGGAEHRGGVSGLGVSPGSAPLPASAAAAPPPPARPCSASGPPRPRAASPLSLPLRSRLAESAAGRREDGGAGRQRGGRGPGIRTLCWDGGGGRGARAAPGRGGRAAPPGGGRAAAADAAGAEQPAENPGEKPAPGQQLPGRGTGWGRGWVTATRRSPRWSRCWRKAGEEEGMRTQPRTLCLEETLLPPARETEAGKGGATCARAGESGAGAATSGRDFVFPPAHRGCCR